MPFLGQDWRSPGQSWVKTADGWKRFLDEKSGSFVSDLSSYCNKEVYNKENLFNSLNYDVAAKKRKKDMLNSKTKTQYFHQENGSMFTKEVLKSAMDIALWGKLSTDWTSQLPFWIPEDLTTWSGCWS